MPFPALGKMVLSADPGHDRPGRGTEPYVAALRAYEWNETIELLANRFFAHCPSARQVVLMDETRGTVRIPDHLEKVSHTDDTASLGLRNVPPGRSLWFNGDYAAIILRRALPGYAHYLFAETDVAVNVDLEPMVAAAARDDIDLVALDVKPAEPDWHWFANARIFFETPWRALLFVMVM